MNPLNITLIFLTSYVICTLLWITLGLASWENLNQTAIFLIQLGATLMLIVIYETSCKLLWNVQPTPMDKTLADAEPSDFFEI
jgi:hypothetical protein